MKLYTKKERLGDVYINAKFREGKGHEHSIMSCVLQKGDDEVCRLPVTTVSYCESEFQEEEQVVRTQWCKVEEPGNTEMLTTVVDQILRFENLA